MLEFQVGDKAVYPAQGVAEVVGIDAKEISGKIQKFYVLRVLDSDMRILVPVDKAQQVGLRGVVQEEQIKEVYDILKDKEIHIDKQTWNRRYRGFMEKIKTGSLFDVAEVYRDLYRLKSSKVLPFGETSNGAPAPVWVPASSVRAIYTLPFVHFVAGLYRYRLGRFAAAAEDYATCLSQADQEDNVTLSAMHQLRGLSQCRAQPDDSEAIRSFDRAVELTPFDARVRSMRALATIVVRSEVVKPSLDDIGAALKLDPGDRVARSLVFGMKGMLAHPAQLGGFGPIGSSVDQHRGDVALLYESAAALRDTIAWKN